MKRGMLVAAALLMMAQPAFADVLSKVNRWYVALRTVERPVFYELMPAGAIIDLKSLGVEQDRTEFIESLDYWEDVAGDLLISKTIISSSDEKVVVDVCYRLPTESFTNRETFLFDGERIVRQIQEKLRSGC